jgi:AraC-like DNA-binding protein
MMACLLLRLRSVAGANWQPISVEVEYRDLGCPELVRRVFGPKITYNARRNAIQVDARTLDREIASSDARLHMLMRALGDRLLEECLTEPNDIVARTRKEIASRLEMGEVTLESIADRLKTAPRTLQTRLSQADATFEGILNDTRRALAVHYLRDTDLLMTEIAFLLGFSELSAFTRAAQRWFGTPPSTYRQQMRKITNGASSNHLH